MSNYWLISVPNEGKPGSETFDTLNRVTEKMNLSKNYDFRIPQLKVGTLDTLMALSDDLAKFDTQIGQIAKKIEKTYFDMQSAETDDSKPTQNNQQPNNKNNPSQSGSQQHQQLKINNLTPVEFVTRFLWNEVRYPKRSPLKALTELIVKEANKSDEALKKQLAEYNDLRGQYQAIERKDTGSLLVKPLSPYIKRTDVIDTEHLLSLFVVVPRNRKEEFERTYETFEDSAKEKEKLDRVKKEQERIEREKRDAERLQALKEAQAKAGHTIDDEAIKRHNSIVDGAAGAPEAEPQTPVEKPKKPLPCRIVVPRSLKKLCDEAGEEFILYRMIIFKEGEDLIKNACREKRYTLRPFVFNELEEKEEKARKIEMAKKKKALWAYLLRWCLTTYSEVFSSWIHLKAIRLYVEAVLRYGLPVDLTCTLIEPFKGKEKQLRQSLKQLYGRLSGGSIANSAEDEIDAQAFGAGGEFYPYVYLPLSLAD